MSLITEHIRAWNIGDEASLDKLIVMTYQRLRISAKRALGDVNGVHSLQATELVNELYCHFKKYKMTNCTGSAEFFGIAAWRLRDILKKKLRNKYARKRDFGVKVSGCDVENLKAPHTVLQQLVLTQSLETLKKVDAQMAQIAELRTFWEFTVPEICDIVNISTSTYHRKWRQAKAILVQQFSHNSLSYQS